MATPDDLAHSGLLYGANFPTWKSRMEAALRVLGLLDFATHEALLSGSGLTTQAWSSKSQAAATIISAHVSPELFSRVSPLDHMNANRLVDRLEKLALRFRFVELPAEIRIRIYDYLIDNPTTVNIGPLRKQNPEYPAVTRTSRLLRTESLPIFYRRAILLFSFVSNHFSNNRNANIALMIRRWTSKISSKRLKLVKTAEAALRAQHIQRSRCYPDVLSPKEVTVTISEKESLEFCSPTGFKQASENLLKRHLEVVEADRKAFDIRGNAVVLALISDPKIWEFGVLQMA